MKGELMKIFVKSLVLTASISLCTPVVADTFCDSLKKVRSMSTSNFDETNAGAKEASRFYVRDSLAGFRSCSLFAFRGTTRTYNCQTGFIEKNALEGDLWKQVTRVERCLGPAVALIGERNGTSAILQSKDELGWVFINSMPNMEIDSVTRIPVMGDVVTLTVQPAGAVGDSETDTEKKPERKGIPSTYADAAQFCPRLMSVIAAAEKNFVPIITKGDEKNGWDTSLKLPSLSSCRVLNGFGNSRYYSCTGSEQPDMETSSQDQQSLRELVDSCLDDDWEFKVRTDDDETKRIGIWKGDYQPTLVIRQRKPFLSGGEWEIKVNVEVPDKAQ